MLLLLLLLQREAPYPLRDVALVDLLQAPVRESTMPLDDLRKGRADPFVPLPPPLPHPEVCCCM